MGFWKTLGDNSDTFGDLAQLFGDYANGAGAGRLAQGGAQQAQDRNAISLFEAKNRAAQQAILQNSTLAQQTGQGDVLANVQDTQFSGLPSYIHMANVSGGLKPSLLGPNARQAGQTLSRNALLQLLKGPTNMATAPELTPLPQASGLEQGASKLSLASGLAKVGSGLLPKAADPTFGGLIQGNKPLPGGTGFPDVPIAGAPGAGGASGFSNVDPFWGWQNNPGRPLNGLFPVTPEDPRHD